MKRRNILLRIGCSLKHTVPGLVENTAKLPWKKKRWEKSKLFDINRYFSCNIYPIFKHLKYNVFFFHIKIFGMFFSAQFVGIFLETFISLLFIKVRMQETRGFALKIKLVPNTYLSTRKNITEIHLHSLWYPSI